MNFLGSIVRLSWVSSSDLSTQSIDSEDSTDETETFLFLCWVLFLVEILCALQSSACESVK